MLNHSAAQQVWRMSYSYPRDGTLAWKVYSLDFDGDGIVRIWRDVKFERFTGLKDVTELACFPLQFHKNHEFILKEQTEAGLLFNRAISEHVQHLYHSGWTFVTGIMAETLEDDKGSNIRYSEYIESDVVIDFKETLRTFPQWQTDLGDSGHSQEHFSSSTSVKTVGDSFFIYSDDVARKPIEFIEKTWHKSYTASWAIPDQDLTMDAFFEGIAEYTWKDDDLVLLPRRIFGYVLRERRFSRLDVTCLQWSTEQNKTNLDNIEMNDNHRKIIRSAVSSHFRAQQREKELNIPTLNIDAIRGKGKGLTILLHGAPGVGKTATAEAVALENKKPLFPITCGDLGTKPDIVDKTLRDIFRYAHLWECILLLDEADIFLTQRERNSLERNALVGVFLRVLEYYRGVLFLTTNRVGALDEAFRSRVHVSLWYPHLTAERTIKVLRSSLDRLPQPSAADGEATQDLIKVLYPEIEDFVKEEYMKYSRALGQERGPWNGRQIRNAVQIAACLALYQKEMEVPKDNYPAVLTASHFQSVAETTSGFESFLKKTRIGDDSYWAQQRNDRADDWRDASDHGDSEYQFEAEEAMPTRRATRPIDRRLLDTDSRAARQPALPTSQRISPQTGGKFAAGRTAMPQPSVRLSRHNPQQSYDYSDNRSGGHDYDDMIPTHAESRSDTRRQPKTAPREYSGEDPDDTYGLVSDEGYPEEWGPSEDTRSHRIPQTRVPLRRQDSWDDGARFSGPPRDRRAGEAEPRLRAYD
ncbi:P-loop containing nucleoside triphosphate hydrolase protein [Nemania sp. FL0916]|nr:P-loop containing nucleoside triphosphate hydrolase protein [Nemania sp. FL0916]